VVSPTPEWSDAARQWKYRITGRDIDGDELTLVVAIEPDAATHHGDYRVMTRSDRPRGCVECGLPLGLERRTAGYPESGLDNVQLIDVPVWVCANGHEEFQIPAVGQLHALLVEMVLRKPAPLTGKEVRFLRKELGFSAREFAGRIAITPVHLSRIETGERPIQPSSDLLIRLYVAGTISARNNEPFPADLQPLVAKLDAAWDVGSHRLRHIDHAPPDRQWEPAAA